MTSSTSNPKSSIGSGKTLNGQTREVVYNVYNYFMEILKADTGRVSEAYDRTSQATGVSRASVRRVIAEAKKQSSSKPVFQTPGTKRSRAPTKSNLNESECDFVRKCIHDFQLIDKSFSLRKLHTILKERISFKGSLTTLRMVIYKLGFRYKVQDNKKVLVEIDKAKKKNNIKGIPKQVPSEKVFNATLSNGEPHIFCVYTHEPSTS